MPCFTRSKATFSFLAAYFLFASWFGPISIQSDFLRRGCGKAERVVARLVEGIVLLSVRDINEQMKTIQYPRSTMPGMDWFGLFLHPFRRGDLI